MELPPDIGIQDPDQRHPRGKGEINHLKSFFPAFDEFQPLLDPGMFNKFPDVDVRIVQKNVRILTRFFQNPDEVVFDVFVSMAAVNKSEVNGRQIEIMIIGKEFIASHLVMGDDVFHTESLEMVFHLLLIRPHAPPADGSQGTIL
jgi:hypothetical protein